jgi:formate hydrogenlyase subunit 4
VLVGVVESGMARLRMNRVPQLLVAASAVAGFGLILLLK